MIKFDHLIKAVIICTLFCLIAPLYADTPWLHVDGNKIKDPNGNIVVLRGVALIDLGCIEVWRGGVIPLINRLINPNDNQGSYTGWGTKVIRLAVYPSDEGAGNYPWYFDDDPNLYYNNLLRPVVDYCKSKDLYVIIDWHYVGVNTYSKVPSTTAFWTYIAQKFAGDSHVLFELFNEPANTSGLSGDAAKWESCRVNMQAWTNIIRSYAPNNLILVGTPQWSQIIAPTATNPVIADNIVYISHIYPDHWGGGTGPYVNQIRTAAAVHPVMITEWGFMLGGAVPTSGTLSGYGQPFHEFREELGIGHTAWCADYSWGPPMFNSDWTLRSGENYMGYFTKDILYEMKDANQPVNGDATPPAVPTGLSATADSESVTLDWNDNTESDMYFYNVYRSTTSGSGYSRVNLLFVRDSNYIDTTVASDTNYYYVVTAVDMSFNESGNSAEVPAAVPPDTTPPLAPTGLWATTDDSMVSLDWNNNTDHDLSGYNIYRSTISGSGYAKINTSLLTTSGYIDNAVNNGTAYYYVVTAVDASSNESDDSDEVSAIPAIPAEVEILGSWTTGTAHAKEAGTNRVLVFVVHAGGNPMAAAPSMTSVTYGGQAMTKVVEIANTSGITRTYTAAFILDDAGITTAGTTTFSPTWGTAAFSFEFAHVFLQNVDQSALTGATASIATSTGATITTAPLVNGNDDMIIEAGSQSGIGTYTANNGFTKDIDLSGVSNLDGVDGHKVATGAAETPSVTHSVTTGRQTLIGFVVKAAPVEWLYGDLNYDNKVDMDDLSEFCTVWWLVDGCEGTAEMDLNEDCVIDFYEFSFFAQNWLEG